MGAPHPPPQPASSVPLQRPHPACTEGVHAPLRFRAELRALPAEESARLLVHTDGISEAQDAEGHAYGEQRLAV